MVYKKGKKFAQEMDAADKLGAYRNRFHIPRDKTGKELIYFCGNSLGLQPVTTKTYIDEIVSQWANFGVEAWFDKENPWLAYCDDIKTSLARIVGAQSDEIAVMNSLSVNLHLLMVSFYRPTTDRFKIIIEQDAFPSDKYIVESQVRMHGYDPAQAIVKIRPREGQELISTQDVKSVFEMHGDSLALVLLGGVNYATGQKLDIKAITEIAHRAGCPIGFDLAHAAGNVHLDLHKSEVDFAAWCNYKYINSGPGSISAVFIHEKHHRSSIPRLEGWWGNNRSNRFLMKDHFDPEIGAEAWVMSTPPLIAIAALKASMSIFDEIEMADLIEKSNSLTGYLEFLLKNLNHDDIHIITPSDPYQRGAQLSIRVRHANKQLFDKIIESGVICDWREPDIIRVAPAPLYNTFNEVCQFVQILKHIL